MDIIQLPLLMLKAEKIYINSMITETLLVLGMMMEVLATINI